MIVFRITVKFVVWQADSLDDLVRMSEKMKNMKENKTG
jgi:hypothetical protein